MNIFYLDKNIEKNAKALCDIHLRKMIVETAQLLSNALSASIAPYKRTHYNHPCSKWIRSKFSNYVYLTRVFRAYLKEYYYRFERYHKCSELNFLLAKFYGFNKKTPLPQCMPEEFTSENIIKSYREYYDYKLIDWLTRTDKRRMSVKYTKRDIPRWLSAKTKKLIRDQ